jgi:hypothetical protein
MQRRMKNLNAHDCFAVIAILFALVSSSQAQVAIRIPDQEFKVRSIKSIGGKIWLATDHGAYQVEKGIAHRIPDMDLTIKGIENINGQVWLATNKGAYRVDGDTARRIPDIDLDVIRVTSAGESVWIEGDQGAYRIIRETEKRFPDNPLIILRIENVNGQVWLATNKGAYRVDGDTAVPITPETLIVFTIENVNGQVWLISNEGAYQVQGDIAHRVPDMKVEVNAIESISGQVWLATDKGTFRIENGVVKPILERGPIVQCIQSVNGKVWLGTKKGLFRVEGDAARRIPDIDLDVKRIKLIDGQVWLIAVEGVYLVEGQTARGVLEANDSNLKFMQIDSLNGQLWVSTSQGAYRIKGENIQRIPDADLDISAIELIDGKVWLTSSKGAYRVDDEVQILVPLRTVLLAGAFKPEVRYVSTDNGNEAYENAFDQDFDIIMQTDKNEFDKAVENQEYTALSRFEHTLKGGRHTLYFSIRDKFGNVSNSQTSIVVVPLAVVLPLVLPLLWLSGLFIVVAFAPNSKFLTSTLMNLHIRKFRLFTLLPLVLAIRVVRLHLLKRYINGIRKDEHFLERQTRFVVPDEIFSPENFGKQIENHKTLFLIGKSGVGKTAYFTYLVGQYALHRHSLIPKSVIPVLLPLAIYQGQVPEEMFHVQLASQGQFTDREMTLSFLQQGGFLILVDGLNEVDEMTRRSINQFIDQYRTNNYFCVSSQQQYVEFTRLEKLELNPLNKERVIALLNLRLGNALASTVVGKYKDGKIWELYKIPQDLELAMALLKRGDPLPQSRQELYQKTLAPILDSWVEDEQSDYPQLLFKRAYEMLRSQDVFFDREDNPLPDEIRDDLVEMKFLVTRAGHHHFRHNLVRDYLAAMYFVPRWRELLADSGVAADANWRPMLEFVLPRLNPTDVKEMLDVILNRNLELAHDLFTWLRSNHPRLCENWADDFTFAFGLRSLQ